MPASAAAPTASSWSPTASSSAPSGSAGPRRCGGSSPATCSNASPRATSSSTSTTASPATSRCSAAAAAGEERDYLELVVRRRRPDLRARRADRPREPLCRRRAAIALAPRWRRVEPDEGAGPEGRRRPRRRAAPPLRGPGRGGGPRLRPRHARGSRSSRPRSPTRRRSTSCGRSTRSRPTWRPPGRWTGSWSGDVGYGKTEVALRAAFKAIQDGRQVAVLVPTTVLADQHVRTFDQRYAAFPATVRLLSRAVSAREQAATLAGLEAGSVDVVVGTHRLLSKDVRFRDLGLLVVDEEQRFGVAAKERLKQLRTRGRRPDPLRDADPADPQPGPRRRPRHVRHRDAAGGPAADPDPGGGGLGRARQGRDPARAGPRRPGVLRPQPRRDDRGAGRPAAAPPAGRPDRRRPRPDVGGRPRDA